MNKKTSLAIAISSLLVVSTNYAAIESKRTEPVVGFKPVFENKESSPASGTLLLGEQVSVSPTKLGYFDRDGDQAADFKYSWTVEGKEVGNTSSITLPVDGYSLVGKELVLAVTPVSKMGDPLSGDPLVLTMNREAGVLGGDGTGYIGYKRSPTPSVSDLQLAGTLATNQTLRATYVFNPGGGNPTYDISSYAWGKVGSTVANVASVASNQIVRSGQVPAYQITLADIGEVLELSLQARIVDEFGAARNGNTITVDTTGKVSGGTGGATGVISLDGLGEVANDEPQLSNLQLAGVFQPGGEIRATYVLTNTLGGTDCTSSFWKNRYGSIIKTPPISISGQVPAYRVSPSDVGGVLTLTLESCVDRKDSNGNTDTVYGNTMSIDTTGKVVSFDIFGNPISVVSTDAATGVTYVKPSVSNLQLAGTLKAGEELRANYVFSSNGGAAIDKSTFAWGKVGSTVANVTSNQIVQSGQVPAYRITLADIGEVLELSLRATSAYTSDNTNTISGNTITVDTTGKVSGGSGGATGVIDPGGKGVVVSPEPLEVNITFTSSATRYVNGVDGNRPVAGKDQLIAQVKVAPNGNPDLKAYTYQWKANGQNIGSAEPGKTTFTPGPAYQGQRISVDVLPIMNKANP